MSAVYEDDEKERIYGKWFYVEKDGPPPEFEVVIVRYSGWWPGRGGGGITDLYWYHDDWFNYPDGVVIEKWMWIPKGEENEF